MNYTDTGQTEGQALMGFEFDNIGRQSEFMGVAAGNHEIPSCPHGNRGDTSVPLAMQNFVGNLWAIRIEVNSA